MSLGFKRQFHPTALRFFEYNPKSWMLNEPGDWNLCRRMLEAGVRMGSIDQIVTHYYPAQLKTASDAPVGDDA